MKLSPLLIAAILIGQAVNVLLAKEIGIETKKAETAEEKETLTLKLNVNKTVAIGNARIDIGTFKETRVRIATLQSEGIHSGILKYVDIIVPSP